MKIFTRRECERCRKATAELDFVFTSTTRGNVNHNNEIAGSISICGECQSEITQRIYVKESK